MQNLEASRGADGGHTPPPPFAGEPAAMSAPAAAPEDPRLGPLVEASTGRGIVSLEPVAAGLGLRVFVRVHLDGPPHTLIARIDAPEDPASRPAGVAAEPPLEPIRAHLEAAGLPVPGRLGALPARDEAPGIELLEDLGDDTLERVAHREPARRDAWYREVLGDVARLQRVAPAAGVEAFERRLDATLFRYKADLFARHGLPLALGREASASEIAVVRAAFAEIAAHADAAPQRLAHRDLQSRNVMIRDGRARWIDLQGAFLAPPEYDLVCLLRDSYVTLPEPEVDALLAWVRPRLPDAPAPETLRRRFDLLTISRKAKDYARFVHAGTTRGDTETMRHLPATARALHGAAARCEAEGGPIAELAAWLRALPEATPEIRS